MAVNQNIAALVDNRTKLRRLLGPGRHLCQLCEAELGNPGEYLCQACKSDLPINLYACPVCALPGAFGLPCASCIRSMRPYSRILACYKYEYPVNRMIQALKYHSHLDKARFLGQQMAVRFSGITEKPGCLIPVPLHHDRLAVRGFNQAHEIANSISTVINIPVLYEYIRRTVATRAQTELNAKQRRQNVRGVFKLVRSFAPGTHHVAIIDDVVTTGATVTELAQLLRGNGIKRVDIWAGARAIL